MDRYEEALERAKKGLPIDEVFPELKESEDERIRKELIGYLTHRAEVTGFIDEDKDCKRWLAYLEKQKEQKRIVPVREATDFEIEVHEIIAQARSDKRLADKDVLEQFEKEASCALMWKAEKQLRNAEKQKEQKPECDNETEVQKAYREGKNAGRKEVFDHPEYYGLQLRRMYDYETGERNPEWSEEDERTLESFLGWLQGSMGEKTYSSWLKSLPERFSLKPKQEWSEEDKDMLNSCISSIEEAKENRYAYKETDGDTSYDHEIDWLKSLRPQPKEQDVEKYPEDKGFEDEWKDYYNNSLVSRQPMNKREVAKHFYWFAKKNAWKPSEEQIDALEYFIRSWGESGTMSPQNTILCAANSLLIDLRKLL